MKKTKDFFVVLFSILICVFLVIFIVQATTTISDDISIGNDLTVNGLASVSESLKVPTIYGNTDAGEYLRIGNDNTTSHGLASSSDLLVTNLLEVDATASFDNAVSVSSVGILLDERVTITSGTASITGSCVIGSIYLRSGVASASQAFNICDATDHWISLASASLSW